MLRYTMHEIKKGKLNLEHSIKVRRIVRLVTANIFTGRKLRKQIANGTNSLTSKRGVHLHLIVQNQHY